MKKGGDTILKISVIVPVYNVEPYLKKCINSILNQSFKEYDIIIINDGTKDNSGKIAEKFAERYPEKVVYIKNGTFFYIFSGTF